jgi:membrane-associated phospholipid phosphatase
VLALVMSITGWAARPAFAQVTSASAPAETQPTSQAEPDPAGAHTGFKALVKDTGGDFRHTFTDLAPLMWMGWGGAAAWVVHPLDDNVNRHFMGGGLDSFWSPGKVLGMGYVQIGAAVATWGIGRAIDKRGRAAHIGLDLLRAQVVTQSLTYGLKVGVRRDRPDLSDGYSFPSGHASTTFASASVLESHFGWKFGVPGYAIAAYVAASRLHENRHWLSDVVFGGALGMAAGRAVTRHGRTHFALVPFGVPDGVGVALTRIAD